jgi:hypothetical protein
MYRNVGVGGEASINPLLSSTELFWVAYWNPFLYNISDAIHVELPHPLRYVADFFLAYIVHYTRTATSRASSTVQI